MFCDLRHLMRIFIPGLQKNNLRLCRLQYYRSQHRIHVIPPANSSSSWRIPHISRIYLVSFCFEVIVWSIIPITCITPEVSGCRTRGYMKSFTICLGPFLHSQPTPFPWESLQLSDLE